MDTKQKSEEEMKRLEEEGKRKKELEPHLVSDLMKEKIKPLDFLVEGLIPAQGITMISGDGGNNKTWIGLWIAYCALTEKKLFDHFEVKKAKALFVDEDAYKGFLQERFGMITNGEDLKFYYISEKQFKLADRDVEILLDYCKEKGIDLGIFDCFSKIYTGKENSAEDMTRDIQQFQRFRAQDMTVIFIHHARKIIMGSYEAGASVRGSSAIRDSVDCHIAIRKLKDGFLVEQTKNRGGRLLDPFKIRPKDEGGKYEFEFVSEIDLTSEYKIKVKKFLNDVLARDEEVRAEAELKEIFSHQYPDIGRKIFADAVDEMLGDGALFIARGKHKKILLSLKEINPDSAKLF